jgi:methylglutaconyl-CoA hydratase
MSYNTLIVTERQEIAQLALNRPDKRNALSHELMQEMLSALDNIKKGRARVLLLTGAGTAFCSGMDLDELKAMGSRSPEENLADSRLIARLLRAVYEFPRPTIAAVPGPAVAGGCGIATLCDFTLASTDAKFGYPETRIGLVPALVAVWLRQQIGDKAARKLLLSGSLISAQEALAMGLVTEVVEPGRLRERADEIASELLKCSPAALEALKRVLHGFAERDLEWQLEAAIAANAAMRSTADFREGLSSFLEKRKPKWRPE